MSRPRLLVNTVVWAFGAYLGNAIDDTVKAATARLAFSVGPGCPSGALARMVWWPLTGWYDVFVLPSGELALVVGDVAGSGLGAAVIMGRIRSTLRAYALEFHGPADVLGKLDRKMQYFEEHDVMATVSYAVLDPDSGQLRISSAAHLPPVIAAPGQHGAVAPSASIRPSALPMSPPGASPRCLSRPAPRYACSPTGWSNAGLSR